MNERIRIKMIKTARTDLPELLNVEPIVAEKGVEYNAVSNQYGAISVLIDNQRLGVKPSEFEFIEAPAWVLEAHKKLVPIYEILKKERDSLIDEVKRLKNENQEAYVMIKNLHEYIHSRNDKYVMIKNLHEYIKGEHMKAR
jgi:hypothetical protein